MCALQGQIDSISRTRHLERWIEKVYTRIKLVGESQVSTAETLPAIIVLYALQEHDSFEQHKGWCKIPPGDLALAL